MPGSPSARTARRACSSGALGLGEPPEPEQDHRLRPERRGGHRILRPPVVAGERDRLLAELVRDRGALPAERSRHREVREAADLQVRPADPPRKLEPLLQMAARVPEPRRPQLGDPEVHQRGGPQVVAQRQLADGLRRQQLLHGPHGLHGGADAPAATRERQRRPRAVAGRSATCVRRAPCRPAAARRRCMRRWHRANPRRAAPWRRRAQAPHRRRARRPGRRRAARGASRRGRRRRG